MFGSVYNYGSKVCVYGWFDLITFSRQVHQMHQVYQTVYKAQVVMADTLASFYENFYWQTLVLTRFGFDLKKISLFILWQNTN